MEKVWQTEIVHCGRIGGWNESSQKESLSRWDERLYGS